MELAWGTGKARLRERLGQWKPPFYVASRTAAPRIPVQRKASRSRKSEFASWIIQRSQIYLTLLLAVLENTVE